jgi:hypothetical protein
LPDDAAALLDGIFGCAAWWNVVRDYAMPDGAKAEFVVARIGGQTGAVIPMLVEHGRLTGLTTPYTCEFIPFLAANPLAATTAFARYCRRFGVVRLDALPAEWDGLPALEQGARQAGLHVLRFDHFGNWSEDVSGLTWDAYLRARPGALRETIRRRTRKAEALPGARFDLFAGADRIGHAASVFEAVYARSWKEPEPFPAFNVALMRSLAETGHLRFGVWSLGAVPVAVQIWVVRDGRAIVLKLAHDEAFKAHSPGTVLTALMLRHLLDREHVRRIDFGRGDDSYKQGWATERRQRIGVLLANPWRPAGMAAILRHRAGRLRARLALR